MENHDASEGLRGVFLGIVEFGVFDGGHFFQWVVADLDFGAVVIIVAGGC